MYVSWLHLIWDDKEMYFLFTLTPFNCKRSLLYIRSSTTSTKKEGSLCFVTLTLNLILHGTVPDSERNYYFMLDALQEDTSLKHNCPFIMCTCWNEFTKILHVGLQNRNTFYIMTKKQKLYGSKRGHKGLSSVIRTWNLSLITDRI